MCKEHFLLYEKLFIIVFCCLFRQWLPREKIEPLGVDSRLDEVKLIESKKPFMRKNVHEAYKRAIGFRRRLEIGENSDEERSPTDVYPAGVLLNGCTHAFGDNKDECDVPSPVVSPTSQLLLKSPFSLAVKREEPSIVNDDDGDDTLVIVNGGGEHLDV